MSITLSDLTPEEVNLLLQGLGQLPLGVSVQLWMKIKQQGESQLKQEPAGLTD